MRAILIWQLSFLLQDVKYCRKSPNIKTSTYTKFQ